MLGRRDHDIYGDFTLPELEVQIKRHARELDLEAAFFQTKLEGEFIGAFIACRREQMQR